MFKFCTCLVAFTMLAAASIPAIAQQNLQTPATPTPPRAPDAQQTTQSQGITTQSENPQQQTYSNQVQSQNPQTTRQTVVANKPAMQGQGKDTMIASMLSLCNQKEVQLGTIAKQHTTNARVKEFADMMIRDHGEMVTSLQQFGARPLNLSVESTVTGSQSTVDTRSGRDAHATSSKANRSAVNPAANETTITTPASTSGQNSPHATAAGFDVFDIHREIAQQCLNEAKADWAKKDPKESDMEYIGQQIVAHKEMIVCGKVLRNHASPELQKAIDRGIATAEGHMEEAHKLIKALGSEKRDPGTDLKD